LKRNFLSNIKSKWRCYSSLLMKKERAQRACRTMETPTKIN
jgi:hypothetical protein